jgi:hypothetical protein
MSRVISGGVEPPVEFGVEYCQVEGVVAGASTEPSSSGLHAVSLDETCLVGIELGEDLCEIIWVWFVGLVVRVPPS